MKKKKNIIIPFSGGLDSTAVLDKAIREGHHITLLYFTIKNNDRKTKRELYACQQIIDYYQKEKQCYLQLIKPIEIDVSENNYLSVFAQVPIWLLGLIYAAKSTTDEIWLGYCMNDDMISYLSDINKIWNSYKSISTFKKFPKLVYPLLKSNKKDRQRELYDDVFQMTVFCETPTTDLQDCGHCDSCKKAKYMDLFYLYLRNQPKPNTGQLSFKGGTEPGNDTIKIDIVPTDKTNELLKDVPDEPKMQLSN